MGQHGDHFMRLDSGKTDPLKIVIVDFLQRFHVYLNTLTF